MTKKITIGIPLDDRVVINPDTSDQRTESGIWIPDEARQHLFTGTVVATGVGRIIDGGFVPVDVKIGDRDLFSKYAGAEIRISGVDLVIMRSGDIMLRLTDEEIEVEYTEPIEPEKFKLEHVNV